jgi:hypothetical protein
MVASKMSPLPAVTDIARIGPAEDSSRVSENETNQLGPWLFRSACMTPVVRAFIQ